MRRWPLAIALIACLSLAPSAAGLSAVDTDEPDEVRLILDEGSLRMRAVEGTPAVADEPVPQDAVPVDRDPEPWHGYERTVRVTVQGTGQVLFWDETSGVVVTAGSNASHGGGASAEPAGSTNGSAEASASGSPSEGPDAAEAPPAGDTAQDGPASQRASGREGSPPTAAETGPTPAGHEGDTEEAAGGLLARPAWLVLAAGLVLGVAPVAWRWLAPRLGRGGADRVPDEAEPRRRPPARAPSWARAQGRHGPERLNRAGRHAARGRSSEDADAAGPRARARPDRRHAHRRSRPRQRRRRRR